MPALVCLQQERLIAVLQRLIRGDVCTERRTAAARQAQGLQCHADQRLDCSGTSKHLTADWVCLQGAYKKGDVSTAQSLLTQLRVRAVCRMLLQALTTHDDMMSSARGCLAVRLSPVPKLTVYVAHGVQVKLIQLPAVPPNNSSSASAQQELQLARKLQRQSAALPGRLVPGFPRSCQAFQALPTER